MRDEHAIDDRYLRATLIPILSKESITVTIKSLKPPVSFSISVHTTDTVAILKSQLAEQRNAPPVDAQRLLLKGKALVDTKLLKEYGIDDGATVNLMIKPGFQWDRSEKPEKQPAPLDTSIPSLVLSTTSPTSTTSRAPIPLSLDTSAAQLTAPAQPPTSHHATISSPDFWHRLRAFLWGEFAKREDADATLEQFLVASKGSLTFSEIAKIRDAVGVVGMGGS